MVESHDAIGSFAVDAMEEPPTDLEGHLTRCGLCAREMEEFFETLGELSRTTSTPPPPGLRRETLATIRTLNGPWGDASASGPMAPGLFLLVLVTLVIWLLG